VLIVQHVIFESGAKNTSGQNSMPFFQINVPLRVLSQMMGNLKKEENKTWSQKGEKFLIF